MNVLEWPDDINFGVAYNGCDGKPLCDDISERIENRTRARQICYIFDSFHHVSLISAQIHEQSKAAQAAGDAKSRELASTFFWKFNPDVQKQCEGFANLARAGITAIMFGALAAAQLTAPEVLGGAATVEEVAVSTEAGIGEGAALVGEGGGGGEGSTGTTGREEGEGGSTTGTDGGDSPGSGNEGGEGRPGSSTDGGDGGPGSTGDGTNEGTGSTEKGEKKGLGVKMPWITKPSYYKTGEPKQIGWHRVAEGKTSVMANMAIAFPVTLAGPALQDAICSAFPNASPGDLDKWTKMLSERILIAAEDYRKNIDSLLKEMNKGNGFGDDGVFVEPFTSILAETIYRDYVRLTEYERDFFIEETSKLELAMTAHFMNAAISLSLKSSMCYLHCTTNIAESETWTHFQPEPGTMCQAQCWQNWGQTKQLEMFGLDALMNHDNHWGPNAEEFLTHSYNHWQWSRFRPDIMFPTIDQLREGTPSNSTSGASVPVCYSPQPIHTYKEEYGNLDKALPCICGDEIGNETTSFFREANFQSWVAIEGGKGLAEAYQTSFQIGKTGPVQAYLAFCHLGWHFPVESDKHSSNSTNGGKHRFGLGPDAMCKQAEKEAKEILKRGDSISDVNCNLCWLSETGKTIKDSQRSYVHHSTLDHRSKYNFKKACEEQVGKEVCKLET